VIYVEKNIKYLLLIFSSKCTAFIKFTTGGDILLVADLTTGKLPALSLLTHHPNLRIVSFWFHCAGGQNFVSRPNIINFAKQKFVKLNHLENKLASVQELKLKYVGRTEVTINTVYATLFT
jgi:hypothetical protein